MTKGQGRGGGGASALGKGPGSLETGPGALGTVLGALGTWCGVVGQCLALWDWAWRSSDRAGAVGQGLALWGVRLLTTLPTHFQVCKQRKGEQGTDSESDSTE